MTGEQARTIIEETSPYRNRHLRMQSLLFLEVESGFVTGFWVLKNRVD